MVDPTTLADDPHSLLAALRADHRVIQLGPGQYMVLRAGDAMAMLTDPRTQQIEGADYVRMNRIPDGAAADFLRDIFLFSNDEAHRQRRGLFARAFAHGAMRGARAGIRETADRIVAGLPRGEPFDFVDRMAARVPAETIAAILGLPRSEAPSFAALVYDMALAVSPVYPIAQHARIDAAAASLYAYVEGHLEARLANPRGDLLSTLAEDWKAAEPIPFQSLVHQVLGMIIGGTDTTRAGFAMLVGLLLQHPRDWAAVKADAALIPGAVAEALRYDPAIGTIARFTTGEVEIGGVTLPAGVLLRVSTMSAMRDPAVYADPDRFDIRRTDHPRLHPVFGIGPHRCIGEMLARIEMEESLAALIAAAPEIELIEAPRLLGFGGIRQITAMQVRIP